MKFCLVLLSRSLLRGIFNGNHGNAIGNYSSRYICKTLTLAVVQHMAVDEVLFHMEFPCTLIFFIIYSVLEIVQVKP